MTFSKYDGGGTEQIKIRELEAQVFSAAFTACAIFFEYMQENNKEVTS